MNKIPGFDALTSAPASLSPITVLDLASAKDGVITLPLGNALLDAEFSRAGRDLIVEAPNHTTTLITNYFATESAPALMSETGKQLRPETVALLSGNPAAGQYAGPVAGAEPIGTVDKLGGDVLVKHADGSESTLKSGDPVYQDDVISTKASGNVGITFVDGSVFTLGSDARMTLDSMIYDPATGEGSSEVTVIKGMFKFVSGEIAANNPGDMVVETPVATIGIRGTTGGGNVIGPGQANQFFLEPNADGTIGSFDVTTNAGTTNMNQPYQQVGINNINQAPPTPQVTSKDAINQEFGTLNQFVPDARYDTRPETQNNTPPKEGAGESSELLATNAEGENAEAAEGEAATEQAANGTDTQDGEELKQVEGTGEELSQTGDANFDGTTATQQPEAQPAAPQQPIFERAPDPLSNPLNQFVSQGTLEQVLSAPQPHTTSQAMTQGVDPAHPAPIVAPSITNGVTALISPLTLAPNSPTSGSSSNQFFQQVQEQIRLGNLPPDTLTNPPKGPIIFNPPPPTTGPTNPNPTNPTNPTNPNPTTPGGPTTNPNNPGPTAMTLTPSSANVETLTGNSLNDLFHVNNWANYSNGTDADILIGGAGIDTLFIDDSVGGDSLFGGASNRYFNSGNSGIDVIKFGAGSSFSEINITGNMLAQSGSNKIAIEVDGRASFGASFALSGTGGQQVEFRNISGAMTSLTIGSTSPSVALTFTGMLTVGTYLSNASFLMHFLGENFVNFGSNHGSQALYIDGGEQTISLGSGADFIQVNAGSGHLINAGDGHNIIDIVGGNSVSVTTGGGNDRLVIGSGSNHAVNLGNGSNSLEILGGAGADVILGGGDDYAVLKNGVNHSIELGGGNDAIQILSDSGQQRNWSITDSGGDDIYLIASPIGAGGNPIGSVNGLEINDSAGNNQFIIDSGQHNVTISGGSGSDRFEINGGLNLQLDGGFNNNNQLDLYEFSHFAGNASINLHTYTSTNGSKDRVEIYRTESGSNITLNMNETAGTDISAELMYDQSYEGMIFSQSGDNLRINLTGGGQTTLSNFFAFGGAHDSYNLITRHHDEFQLLHNAPAQIIRELGTGTQQSPNINLMIKTGAVGTQELVVEMATLGLREGDNITINSLSFGGTNIANGTYAITGVTGSTVTFIVPTYTVTTADIDSDSTATFSFISREYVTLSDFQNSTTNITAMNVEYVVGKGGNDNIIARQFDTGTTSIFGGDGNDMLTGGEYDVLDGGDGNDTLSYFAGVANITLIGGAGFDVLDLNGLGAGSVNLGDFEGIEAIWGNSAANTLIGSNQTDAVNHFRGMGGNDVLTGGTGVGAMNIADYSNSGQGVLVALDAADNATVIGGAGVDTDTLIEIQNLIGSQVYGDTLDGSGSSSSHILYGLGGNDILKGGNGADTLIGGAGQDHIYTSSMVGGDNEADVIVYEGQATAGFDTIHYFQANAVTPLANDVLDISQMKFWVGLADYDYFDLVIGGKLQFSDLGADTRVSLEGNNGTLHSLAILEGVSNVTELSWRNFITEESLNSVRYISSPSLQGGDYDEIFDVQYSSINTSSSMGKGDDTFILNDFDWVNGYNVDGGLGFDRLVLNDKFITEHDFRTMTGGENDLRGFEVLDLNGRTNVTHFSGQDIIDLTGGKHELFIQNSAINPTTALNFGLEGTVGNNASFDWQLVDPNAYDLTLIHAAEFDTADYQTYKTTDGSGNDLFIHIQDGISTIPT